MGVGRNLKEVLRERKITLKDLAMASGIPVNTLYSITKRDSDRIDPVVLNSIADTLGISAASLKDSPRYTNPYDIKKIEKRFIIPPDLVEDFIKTNQYYEENGREAFKFSNSLNPQENEPAEVKRMKKLFSYILNGPDFSFEDRMRIMFDITDAIDQRNAKIEQNASDGV